MKGDPILVDVPLSQQLYQQRYVHFQVFSDTSPVSAHNILTPAYANNDTGMMIANIKWNTSYGNTNAIYSCGVFQVLWKKQGGVVVEGVGAKAMEENVIATSPTFAWSSGTLQITSGSEWSITMLDIEVLTYGETALVSIVFP